MNKPKIRLTEPPTIYRQSPKCGACIETLVSDADGYTCPQCGTSWDHRDDEDADGTLYAEWSGETVEDLPLIRNEDARKWTPGDSAEMALITDHPFVRVAGHSDDDECTERPDGTDNTYCGRTEYEHESSTR